MKQSVSNDKYVYDEAVLKNIFILKTEYVYGLGSNQRMTVCGPLEVAPFNFFIGYRTSIYTFFYFQHAIVCFRLNLYG